jgi:hypothetical protein
MTSSPWSRVRWALLLTLLLTATAALLAIAVSADGNTRCTSYPVCFFQGAAAASTAHALSGAALFLAALLLLWTTLNVRREDRRALPLGLSIPLLVAIMGGLGASFATGSLATTWIPLQVGLLLLLVLLQLALLSVSYHPAGPSASGTGTTDRPHLR